MNRHKWHLILVIGLVLVLAGSAVGCAKQPKSAPRAPDFTLQSIDGKKVTLSQLRGKPVMVNFWTIHCPACMLQMPYIQAFYDNDASKQATVLTINVGESPTVVRDFVISKGFTFPVLLDSQGGVARAYGLPGVPVTFFIDAEGLVKAYKIGPFQSPEEIESIFKSL